MLGVVDIGAGEHRATAVAAKPIEFHGVDVSFPVRGNAAPRKVLRGFDLSVEEGELVVLVGRSGCGKTTALNLAAGLLTPTAGDVRVVGQSPREARDSIGYMLARDALLPWRTALRNVEFGLELRGVPRSERGALARRFLRLVDLEDAADKYPRQLSQGMRQRVALARTWALSPRVLLMDEPFAALDAQTRAEIHGEFLHLWQSDPHSVLFVTHDLHEAIILADRILVMVEGRTTAYDVPFDRPRDPIALGDNQQFKELYRTLLDGLSMPRGGTSDG